MSRSVDLGSFAPTGLEFQLGKTSGEAKVQSVPPKHDPVFKPVAGEPLRPHLFDSYHDTTTDQEPEVAQMLQQAPFINNMVLELPVPPRLYIRVVPVADSLLDRNSSPRRNEFSHTRYSAATCDPRSFAHSGFTLRQPLFIQPRQTEICIAITMYNEDESLLGLTLASIHHNIDYLQKLQNDENWGPHSWRKVVICIIIDGRKKINPRTKALLACLGIYQDFGRLESYNGKDVVAHIFEYTTRASLRIRAREVVVDPGASDAVMCQTILCLKERNQRKINSHHWFLSAFCEVLQPKVCVLVDAGLQFSNKSIYELWRPIDTNHNIAASIGTTSVMTNHGKWTINPLVGFQVFEYQMTNSLERPLESIIGHRFGTNNGGFCAYRFSAVSEFGGESDAMRDYYQAAIFQDSAVGIRERHSYLTEERIIAWALLTSTSHRNWRKVSVDTANARIDVPMSMADFIIQRRRWINGDLYSTLNELSHVYRLVLNANLRSYRSLMIGFGFLYQAIRLVLQYFCNGNLIAIFWIITRGLGDSRVAGTTGRGLALSFNFVYGITIFASFVICLGNRPRVTTPYMLLCLMWVVLEIYFMFAVIYLLVRNVDYVVDNGGRSAHEVLFKGQFFMSIVWPIVITFGIWVLAPLTQLRRPHLGLSLVWYVLLLPTCWNIVYVYASCNSHDIMWGNSETVSLPSTRVENTVKNLLPDGSLEYHELPDGKNLDKYYAKQAQLFAEKAPLYGSPQYGEDIMDHFKTVRTISVLCWVALNSALVMAVLNITKVSVLEVSEDGGRGYLYIGTILWANTGVFIIQFLFNLVYCFGKLAEYASACVFRSPKARSNSNTRDMENMTN